MTGFLLSHVSRAKDTRLTWGTRSYSFSETGPDESCENGDYAAALCLGIAMGSAISDFGRRAMSGNKSEHNITAAMVKIAG